MFARFFSTHTHTPTHTHTHSNRSSAPALGGRESNELNTAATAQQQPTKKTVIVIRFNGILFRSSLGAGAISIAVVVRHAIVGREQRMGG